MKLPNELLESLQGTPGFDRAAFEAVHEEAAPLTSFRINPAKPAFPGNLISEIKQPVERVPWSQFGYYLPERPSFTFDPFFHAGCYYVQEASSMFIEQAIQQHADNQATLKVLDCCAAPGGKSTHLQSILSSGSLLVTNEVIRSRAAVLKDNIIKWGTSNVIVTNNDPKDFSNLENYFDVIVVDAPCSGSGLFRRDAEAIEEWSINNVQLCSQRQQRILADCWPALKNGGLLVYATCSFSKEEDEVISNWLRQTLSAEKLKLTIDPSWGIIESDGNYRFWPDKVKGEGFFMSCFRKLDEENETPVKSRKKKLEVLGRKEKPVLEKWVKKEGLEFLRHQNTVFAWPEQSVNDFHFLVEHLKVIYSGIITGELIRDKLVPDHALALSGRVNDTVPRVELNYDQAIQYLQRKELALSGASLGWQLVTYQQQPMGWINVLANRINNYYPKELRILKNS